MHEEALKVLQDIVTIRGGVLAVKHQRGYWSPGVDNLATYLRDMGYIKFTHTLEPERAKRRYDRRAYDRTNLYKVTPLGREALEKRNAPQQ